MPVSITKSDHYAGQTISFIDKGLGGTISITEAPYEPPVPPPVAFSFLSSSALFGQGGTRRGYYKGGGGEETWSMGNYWSDDGGWFRSVLWKIESNPDNTSSSYSMAIPSNSPPSGLQISLFRRGFVDSDGNYRTAGVVANEGAFEYIPSVVTVFSATNVVSSTLIQPDGMPAIVSDCDMTTNTLGAGGATIAGSNVWRFDLTTNVFSGTMLNEPAYAGIDEAKCVAIDASEDLYAFVRVATVSTGPLNISGSIWKVSSGGAITRLLLSGSDQNYYNFFDLKTTLNYDRNFPTWVGATCLANGPPIGGVMVWKISNMSTESSGTILLDPLGSNSVELVGMKPDGSGGAWVLGKPVSPIGSSRSVIWHVYGSPTQVSGTVIESPYPSYPVTIANDFDVFDAAGPPLIPIAAVTAFDTSLLSSRAMWYAYVPPEYGGPGYSPAPLSQSTLDTPSNSADVIEADSAHAIVRVAGTYGSPKVTQDDIDPSFDTRQGFWKITVSGPFTEVQTFDVRVPSGSVP